MEIGSNIEDTIRDLNARVSQFTDKESSISLMPSLKGTSYMRYILIPLVIGGALLLIKPGFVMETDSVDGEYPEPRVKAQKFLLVLLVLSVASGIGVYMYFYRKRKAID